MGSYQSYQFMQERALGQSASAPSEKGIPNPQTNQSPRKQVKLALNKASILRALELISADDDTRLKFCLLQMTAFVTIGSF